MYFVGIDSGKQGAIAILNESGELEQILDMPLDVLGKHVDSLKLFNILLEIARHGQIYITLEECRYTPKMNESSDKNISVMTAFSFGRNYQACVSVLEIFQKPYNLVRPEIWKARFALFNLNKEGSILKAIQLFPKNQKDIATRKKCDGRAEALLIAEYGRRTYNGEKSFFG